ncbi:uncharacterized protein [Primulina huaijiensis]|uniref:uncharacterized protein n=1 Tax=Primulina huaijiensis TaxID=1492673 RepID=UPI003CC6DE92
MAIATIVAATLQGIVNPLANAIQPPPEPQPRGIKYHYESLRRNRVSTFDGNPDPEVSHNWLKNVESQLNLLEVPEELRVEVVTPFLEDRARKWWETVSPSLTETPDMTVMEYTSRFNDLGTYVPTIMSDETLKMHRIKKRLNNRIQSALAVFKPNNVADLMGATMSAETNIKRREEENRNKRPLVSQFAQNGPKFKKPNHSSGPSRVNFNSAGNIEGKWCDTCRQKHTGECYRKTGNIFIKRIATQALIDSRATHSFISETFASHLDIKMIGLDVNYSVTVPSGEELSATSVVKDIDLELQGHLVFADLIVLPMPEFDIILGMDWLTKNRVLIDF